MPHTSRKNRPSRHSKRVNVEGDDGWTVVANTKQTLYKPDHPPQRHLESALIPSGYTLDKLTREFDRCWKIWQTSETHLAVRGILQNISVGRLESCVCVGLGSMVDPISRKHALFQLAALQAILSGLEATQGGPIGLYAQDPVFNALDVEFLSSLGFRIVQPPTAFDLIAESSLVYAPHCERSFFVPGLKGKDPALAICNNMEPVIHGPMSTSISPEDTEIIHQFLKGRASYRFPKFDQDDTVFNDLKLYYKEESTAI